MSTAPRRQGFAQNVSITERPSIGQAEFDVRASTPILKNRPRVFSSTATKTKFYTHCNVRHENDLK
jgi:hypothetical protein